MAEIVGVIVGALSFICGTPTCNFIDQYQNFNDNVGELRRILDTLTSQKRDIESIIEQAEARGGQTVRQQVQVWRKQAQEINVDVRAFLEKVQGVKWYKRVCLDKRVCRKIKVVADMIEKGSFTEGLFIERAPAHGNIFPTEDIVSEMLTRDRENWEDLTANGPVSKVLLVIACEEIERVVELDSSSSSLCCSILDKLELLELWGLPRLCELVRVEGVATPLHVFSNLKTLKIEACTGMRKLLPLELLQALQNLEEIRVVSCKQMEEIIALSDSDASSSDKFTLTFPKLRELCLWNLPQLKSICSVKGVTFCILEEKEIDVSEMQTLSGYILEDKDIQPLLPHKLQPSSMLPYKAPY
ncbi:hypothetical protein SLEP1_g27042 [Rubroshorea leprosula]|uniref:Disease resistance protein At4g27190-like leucine-rich repeats domain-containing protein n=1 Tax=Rubroshorea leprosula TaxID=152421 RepID=A0AAV5JZW0_9ROSI|nr:hypothetical protein SLEP1_g27042 [Rubroshorea leprosula]